MCSGLGFARGRDDPPDDVPRHLGVDVELPRPRCGLPYDVRLSGWIENREPERPLHVADLDRQVSAFADQPDEAGR